MFIAGDITLYTIDQYSFSAGPHILTIVYNVTSGRTGEQRFNFSSEVRPRVLLQISKPACNMLFTPVSLHPLAVVIDELTSDEGIIEITEGRPYSDILFASGFSYGVIPIQISTLTFSEYAAEGFDLEDDFDTIDIPTDAADGKISHYRFIVCLCCNFPAAYDYETIDKTLSLSFTSQVVHYDELFFDAYLDGIPEELEGFVLYLELIESELDPRDVGHVNLSQSVYLIIINQSGMNVLNFAHLRKLSRSFGKNLIASLIRSIQCEIQF